MSSRWDTYVCQETIQTYNYSSFSQAKQFHQQIPGFFLNTFTTELKYAYYGKNITLSSVSTGM